MGAATQPAQVTHMPMAMPSWRCRPRPSGRQFQNKQKTRKPTFTQNRDWIQRPSMDTAAQGEQLVAVHRQLLRKYASLELENAEARKKLALRDERIKQLEVNTRMLAGNMRTQVRSKPCTQRGKASHRTHSLSSPPHLQKKTLVAFNTCDAHNYICPCNEGGAARVGDGESAGTGDAATGGAEAATRDEGAFGGGAATRPRAPPHSRRRREGRQRRRRSPHTPWWWWRRGWRPAQHKRRWGRWHPAIATAGRRRRRKGMLCVPRVVRTEYSSFRV
jgi:hypothetical protein